MKKNKLAGLLIASALVVGATGTAAHAHTDNKIDHNKNDNNKLNNNEVLLASTAQTVTKNAMVVNGNNELVLRCEANSTSPIVSNVSVGEMLEIQSYNSNWYKVTVRETGATGYISSSNIRFIESGLNSTATDMNNNGQVINVSSALNLRSEATMSSDVIRTLSNGTNFKIVASQGQWYKIDVNGTYGYVYGGYVKVGSEITPVKKLTKTTENKPLVTKKHISKITTVVNKENAAIQSSTNNKTLESQPIKAPVKTEVKVTVKPQVKVAEASTNESSTTETKTNEINSTKIGVKTPKINLNNAQNQESKNTVPQVMSFVAKIPTNNTTKVQNPVVNKTQQSPVVQNKKIPTSNKVATTTENNNINKVAKNTNDNIAKNSVSSTNKINNPNSNNTTTITKHSNSNTETITPMASNSNNSVNTNKNVVAKPVVENGSVTFTLYQTSTDQPLTNTNIIINGTSYTTNTSGKIKISNLTPEQTKFTFTSNDFNSTYANVNIKAGKNMNTIIYMTKTPMVSRDTNANNTNSSTSPKEINNTSNNKPTATTTNTSTNHIIKNNNTSKESNINITPSSPSNSQLQQDIVNYAENFLGRPYVWGATGPNAFDCSGLTYYVYKHFGYYIGRTTYTQIDKGTPVSLNNLEPGDLIFWGNPNAPYHVAIYIGNGQYIQAPHTGETVDISSWNLDNISAARRII